MRYRGMFLAVLLLGAQVCFAQLKSDMENEARVSDGLLRQGGDASFLGWLNPANFQMRQSIEMSYQTLGARGMSLGTYTNSMMYRFADNLSAQADVSLSYSPNNPFSSSLGGSKNNLSSLYLSRLQMDWKPFNNMLVQFQYRQLPYGGYFYSPFTNPWYRGSGY